ncbi:MAG: response regulator receiver [Nitrospirae bacterium]|nr:MAG: response regulator receiver [Nitrospirota bacterium]
MKRANVLLVDDEADLAQTLARRLNMRHYRARSVYSAPEALEAVSREAPEVMVIDLHLPGMPGNDLARAVRQVDSTVAIILLSGQGSLQTENWIHDGLIVDFVMKPVEIQELTKKIDSAKNEHDARCARKDGERGKHGQA